MDSFLSQKEMLSGWLRISRVQTTLDRYAEKTIEKVEELAPSIDKEKIVALVRRALNEARTTLFYIPIEGPTLPISQLCPSDLISRGHVGISVPSLFQAVRDRHFYFLYRNAPRSGFYFPTWQFCREAIGRLHYVLPLLNSKSDTDVHVFWVQASEQLNELSAAEMLAGAPFETRFELAPSQQRFLALDFDDRLSKVKEWVNTWLSNQDNIIL